MQTKSLFLPEGSLINTEENKRILSTDEGIYDAIEKELIVEGEVIVCDRDHNLIVDLCGMHGIIPHRDTALGIESGNTKEIAVISRVGKPVSCIIKGIGNSGKGKFLKLSRSEAQKKALSLLFKTLTPGDIIPAKVTHLEQFGAFVDIGCGNISLIGIESISVSRISHPRERFNVGDDIFVAVSALDIENQRVFLSHRELLGTWEENVSRFQIGQTVQGVIRGIEEYGVFVELAPNLSGLAENRNDVSVDDRVSVYIKNIISEKMKIKLVIIDTISAKTKQTVKKTDYFISNGHIDQWYYSPDNCPKKNIFTLF